MEKDRYKINPERKLIMKIAYIILCHKNAKQINMMIDALNDKVKALQLDGVAPSEETVKDGSYTLQRPFVMATKGEISEQSAQVQAVFEFINSDAGQEVISSVGLVSAK